MYNILDELLGIAKRVVVIRYLGVAGMLGSQCLLVVKLGIPSGYCRMHRIIREHHRKNNSKYFNEIRLN